MQYEDDIAHRWWALPPGSVLPLADGGWVRLVFPGYPGGSVGPDVHDAVLCLSPSTGPLVAGELPSRTPEQHVGDVEFHMRASDWVVHQHHTDPRYNNVILHVVLVCDGTGSTIRQDGHAVPVCSLQDLPLTTLPLPLSSEKLWACHRIMPSLSIAEVDRLLLQAGLLRFEQKAHTFVEQLHQAASIDEYSLYDTCLIPALAEGLGYGRDREFFRAAGLRLLNKAHHIPEPQGRALQPSPLDAARLRVLARLVAQWSTPSVWVKLHGVLLLDLPSSAIQLDAVLQAIRDMFCMQGLSLARTDILICNVVLPFAAAIALLEHDTPLYNRAQTLYMQHPGLSSNRITRLMSAQLLLLEEPQGSCRQQGLHFIYQQTCRKKHCEICLIGKRDI